MNVKESKGKLIVDIDLRAEDIHNGGIVLSIFSTNHTGVEENFVFKYQSSATAFKEYYTDVDYKIDELDANTFNIIVEPITNNDEKKTLIDGMYYVTLYKAQDVPDKSKIASISLNGLTPLLQARARANSTTKKVEIKVSSKDIPAQPCDVVVHAIIGDDNEMFSYEVKELKEDNTVSNVLMVVGVVIVIVIIVLAVCFILRKRSKNNLKEQVSNESFEGGKLMSDEV
jgi:hypothetical protein